MKPLSPNQGYIVSRLLEHIEVKIIAAEMRISPFTVYRYVARAKKKAGVNSTSELLQLMAKKA